MTSNLCITPQTKQSREYVKHVSPYQNHKLTTPKQNPIESTLFGYSDESN